MHRTIAFIISLAAAVRGQHPGTLTTEYHPTFTWQKCTAKNSCTTVQGKLVLDSNWRWVHDKAGTTNCYDGNEWDATLCPDDVTCTSNCVLEGISSSDFTSTYGASVSGSSLKLTFVTKGQYATNIGSRFYLLESDTAYQQFSLLNQEFTFDVDVSNLPCGLNGALYLASLDPKGSLSSGNTAGAKYGTGYCDAQCPRDLKFINGKANVEGWQPSSNDQNAGVGNRGACCAEMDIWEANSVSTALTPHSADQSSFVECSGSACGGTYSDDRYAGTTDPDGCDWNSYRNGNTTFYGKGKTVDTSKVFTVVTQFIGNPLTEIRRFYVQNGKLIPNAKSNIPGITGNSITPSYCDAEKSVFGDVDPFKDHGGFSSMSSALSKGMTLVMSLWDDHYANMLWLDSTYPTDKTSYGGPRGECATSSGVPADVESQNAGASVTYSNIKTGPINSTYTAT